MKVASFAFLLFCASVARAQLNYEDFLQFGPESEDQEFPIIPRTQIAQNIKHAADAFIRKSVADFHKIEQKFKDVSEKIRVGAENVAKKVKDKVKQSNAAIEKTFKDIVAKGKLFFNCVKENFPEFKDLKNVATENIGSCAKNIFETLQDFEKAAAGHSTELVKALAELAEIVSECVSGNAAAAAKCALNHIDEAKKLVAGIIEDFEFLVKVAKEKAPALIDNVHVCKDENFAAIAMKIKEVGDKMHQCTKGQ